MSFHSVVLYVVLVYSSLVLCESPKVKTSYGYLEGKHMTSRSGKTFSTFLGIPYAASPTGKLRFRPPVPPAPWEGVRNATQEQNICSQGKYGGQEDCLYLNIFSHNVQNGKLMPVLFYIHGGSFYMSSPIMGITGPEYFMDKDIVLVTVQYRLGPFGFLSTGDSVIPGNMGLKDQVKALEWVRENIKVFGGDPNEVTLFGCSAGASSVHLHMQSPMSETLFKRGISQSGTSLSAFALTAVGAERKSIGQFADYLDCPTENSTELLQCLQKKSTQEIERAHRNLQNSKYAITESIFRPVVENHSENAFIPKNPFHMPTIKPWLTGITANEGILNIEEKYLNYTVEQIIWDFHTFVPKALLFEELFSSPKEISNKIHDFYFKNYTKQNELITAIEKLYTDWWYLWPLDRAISMHNGTVYCYLYDHLGEHSYVDIYDNPKGFGVSHLDDLISLFGHSRYFQSLNTIDTHISKLMVDLWVNFATYGDPTPYPISRNPNSNIIKDFKWDKSDVVLWKQSEKGQKHIQIQTNLLSNKDEIYFDRLKFWRSLLTSYKMLYFMEV